MSIYYTPDFDRTLNGNDLEAWRATLGGIETQISDNTDLLEKAKRESTKRIRQDAVSDVLWAARWMFGDAATLLERRRASAVAEITRLEAEQREAA